MVKQVGSLVLCALAAVPLSATPTVRTMYVDAMAKEQAVRSALAGESPAEPMLKAVRTVISAYEALVRHYPTSSYSDNALWQAGRLAFDAFERFGQTADRDAAIRLWTALTTQYPTSKLAKQAALMLESIERSATKTAIPRSTTAAQSSPPANAAAAKPPPPPVITTPQAATPARSKIATISDIRRTLLPDVVRVTIAIDTEVVFHEERIPGPARIFVDLFSTRTTQALVDRTLRFDSDADMVRQVRIGRHPNATTRIVLDATGVSSYSVYPLYSPYRLVIDCVRSAKAPSEILSASAPTLLLSPQSAATVSLEPQSPVAFSAALEDQLKSRARAPEASKAALGSRSFGNQLTRPISARPLNATLLNEAHAVPLSGRRIATEWGRRLPRSAPAGTALLADARASVAATGEVLPASSTQPVAPPLPAPPARSTNLAAGFSMARQLGLGVSRIVIDPGHGGHDPGAKGKGITEAELVLDVALRLEKLLQDVGGVDVILTRRTDDFVPLQERTAIANREGADLFLSIHANASANIQARGIETYFLNFANNLSAAAVAARENAASGQTMGALPDFVKAIALNNKLAESRDFATLVQRSLIERVRDTNKTVKNLGVKQAPFVVLIGASMPSVLAEISFLTNPFEAKLVKGGNYRQRIAEALFDAIGKYQVSLAGVQAAAHH